MAKEKLDKSGLIKIEGWARAGLTDRQIAKNMGIAYSTFNKYKKDYIELMEALKKGKEVVDLEVEGKLYERAIGFHYTETKVTEEVNALGQKTVRTETINKYALPDTTAQIFWLKNRMPTKWRNKVIIEDDSQLDKLDVILEGIQNAANT